MAALQKELEQLHTAGEHMEEQYKAAEAGQLNAQARARTLQQELGDLKTATKQADIAFKGDISSLKGQLEASFADCTDALDQKRRLEVTLGDSHEEISSLKGQMGSARAGSAKELSNVKGQLLQAFADSAKETSRLREQLETALAASRDVHQQEKKAFMAGRAAMASESDRQATVLKQQIQQLQCNWRIAQQDVEQLSRQLWSKPSLGEQAQVKQLQQQLAGKEKELATFVAQAISLKDEVSSLKQELISSKQSLASAHAHHTAQRASSGEQVATLQKELEQPHTAGEHMEEQYKAGHARQLDAQASKSDQQVVTLEQRIQLLQCNWRKAQQDVEKLSRQLWSRPSQATAEVQQAQQALADMEQRFKSQVTALTDQVAASDKQAKVQEGLHTAAVKRVGSLEARLIRTQKALIEKTKITHECYALHDKIAAEYADLNRWRAMKQEARDGAASAAASQAAVNLKREATRAVEQANSMAPNERRDFVSKLWLKFHPDQNPWMPTATEEIFKALQNAGLRS